MAAPNSKAKSSEERLRNVVPLGGHGLQLRRRVFERDVDDPVALQRRHLTKPPFVRQVGRLQAEPGGEHAVARSRGAAPLDVAEHRDPSLEAGALLDLAGERVADAALGEPNMAELVLLALVGEPLELVALRDDDDREVLAALVAA